MKKTALFAPMALLLALATGCTASAMGSSTAETSGLAPAGSPSSNTTAGIAGSADSSQYIAQTDAENIALTDAGLTADALSGSYTRLEYDDGRAVYDVEFWTADKEYDYEIDAVTGEILSYDYDAEHYTAPAASGTQITSDDAKRIALEHAGIAEADATRFKVELDEDDGRQVYEVEWEVGRTEYSYEISAADGSILNYETDHD